MRFARSSELWMSSIEESRYLRSLLLSAAIQLPEWLFSVGVMENRLRLSSRFPSASSAVRATGRTAQLWMG